jgi:hypothetical protein
MTQGLFEFAAEAVDLDSGGEVWRRIPGFLNYEASSWGRVRKARNCRYLKQGLDKKGYLQVHVTQNGRKLRKFVHQMVALAFLVPPSPRHNQVNHKDKRRSNNRLSNLEWVTLSENCKHRWRTPDPED